MHLSISWLENDKTPKNKKVTLENAEFRDFEIQCRALNSNIDIEIIPLKEWKNAKIELYIPIKNMLDTKVGVNGYQSWTFSKEYSWAEKSDSLNTWTKLFRKKYHLEFYGDQYFNSHIKSPGCFLSYHHIYLKRGTQYFLWASANEKNGFTFFRTDPKNQFVIIEKEVPILNRKNESIHFQILFSVGTRSEIIASYKKVFPPARCALKAAGWTSWYNFYHSISEQKITHIVKQYANEDIPIRFIQIDDGWQKSVGDWSANNHFPSGMKSMVDNIKKANFEGGLWLAPFICEDQSKMHKEHPDWIMKDANGHKIKAGFSPDWSDNFYALDIDNKRLQAYLKGVFEKATDEWGFSFFKLDFLYAACIGIKNNETRGARMNRAMMLLREWIGDAIILGCGVPLGSATHLVDYCRISADVALKWEDALLKNIIKYPERVSTYSCLSSNIQRNLLDGVFFKNDPDVFLLREGTKLSEQQKKTLFLVNQVVGSLLFTSDDISTYSSQSLDLYKKQFPLTEVEISTHLEEEDCHQIEFETRGIPFVLMANLSRKHQSRILNKPVYDGSKQMVVRQIELDPFESKIVRVVRDNFENNQALILFADDHIFPGVTMDLNFKNGHVFIDQLEHFVPWKRAILLFKTSSNIDNPAYNQNGLGTFNGNAIVAIENKAYGEITI